MRFSEVATSLTSLRTNKVALLPVYLMVREEDIPPEADVARLVATILLGIEEKVLVFQVTRTLHRN